MSTRGYTQSLTSPHTFSAAEWKRKEGANFGSTHKTPPQWVLDRIADESLTGKYDTRKSNICKTCFTAKSMNGKCMCE